MRRIGRPQGVVLALRARTGGPRCLLRGFPFCRAVARLPVLAYLLAAPILPAQAQVALRADPARSEFQIELGRAGLLKALGDDHLIRAGDYQCDVLLDEENPVRSSVRLVVRTSSLKVLDPKLSSEKRAEVQKRMQGAEILDVARFPEITFVSRKVTQVGYGRFRVEGDLTIRETTRAVSMEVTLGREEGVARISGGARIHQTAFGIQPVSAGAGTVKVKDEMKIVFQLLLVPAQD